jgi:hypothetical protein
MRSKESEMQFPKSFTRIVKGIRYDVDKAMLIAHNLYWDGSNWDRRGRNTFLYKTENGRYFVVKLTMWQGERDRLSPVSEAVAKYYYELLPEHTLIYEKSFPGAEVQEA